MGTILKSIPAIRENRKVITQIEVRTAKPNRLPSLQKVEINTSGEINQILLKEKEALLEKNKFYELELESVKTELENALALNKEYESVIENLKLQNATNSSNINNHSTNKESDIWRKEYCDLLDKSISTNVSTTRLLATGERFRPMTAQPKSSQISNDYEYENTLENLRKLTKRKNSLDDSIDNKVDEDLDEEDQNEAESDDKELDDLLRKSMTDLNSLKEEIK